MDKFKFIYSVDKAKLCYYQPSDLFSDIAKVKGLTLGKQGFSLYVPATDTDKKKGNKTPNSLDVRIYQQSDIEPDIIQEFGTLKLHSTTSDYEGFCFLTIENRCLYQSNYIKHAEHIAQTLGLTFSHITCLDIAMDCNVNLISRVRNLVKHHEEQGLEMIFNNKKVKDTAQILKGWREIYSRTCKRLINNPSLYLSPVDEEAPSMVIYDKSREIQESGKDYIAKHCNFGKGKIYRSEIRLKRKALKAYFKERPLKGLEELQDQATLNDIWQTFTHRILHFTFKRTRQQLDLIDILKT